jgi:ornithine carbamoyltransferase
MTIEEARGELTEQHVVYLGDGNNIANSLIEGSALAGYALTIISPPGYQPDEGVLKKARSIDSGKHQVTLTDVIGGLDDASVIYTDVWASMGQEDERAARQKAFAAYQVDERIMAAAPRAVFMHCLPAHRGEEVIDGVIDGPRSIVFQQAENRLYAQMALMSELFAP